MTRRLPILIATRNKGKLREVLAVLADLPVELSSLDDCPALPEPDEDADTFEGNALRKAQAYARATGRLTLADDSGLEVDALGGMPGVYSARYASMEKSANARSDDTANNARLIRELADVPTSRRSARFRCVVVLADAHRVLATGSGTIDGRIIDEPRGNNGFGYDPHFFVPALNKTMAELEPAEKNRISHRGQALRCIRVAVLGLVSARQGP